MVAFLVLLLILFLVLATLFVYPLLRRWFGRKFFNRRVNRRLYRLAREEDYYLINNLVLDLGENALIHIDHLLCGDKYIYAIADRYLGDGIEGSLEDNTVFCYRKGKRVEIKNPIPLNETRALALAKYLNWTEDKPPLVISVIVVNDELIISKTLELHGPHSYLVRIKSMYSTIKGIEYESKTGRFDEVNLQKMVDHIAALSAETKATPDKPIR